MYEMKIRVRYSEVDREGIARLHQILEYFQDCGTFQSEELGLGVEEDQKNHRDRKSTRLNSSHDRQSRMPSSA